MGDKKSECWLTEWAENTHIHGFYEAYFAKSSIESIFWILLMLSSSGLAIWQIQSLVVEYQAPPHYSSRIFMQDNNSVLFPNITVCKFHRVQKHRVKELNITSKALSHLFISMLYAYDLETYGNEMFPPSLYNDQLSDWEAYYTNPDTTLKDPKDIMKYIGFSCESIFLECRFAWQRFNCCANAVPVVNQYGQCWVLNVPVHPIMGIPVQIQNGVTGGMRVILYSDKKNELNDPENLMFNNYLEAGFALIPSFDPNRVYPTNPVVLDPGAHSWVSLRNKITYHVEPQFQIYPRLCEPDRSLKFLKARYTKYSCLLDCVINSTKSLCGCALLGETIEREVTCNGTDLVNCVLPQVAGSHDPGREECQAACADGCETQVATSTSLAVARWPSEEYAPSMDALFSRFFPNVSFTAKQMHISNIFFESTEVTVEEKAEKIPLFQLIGSIGGHLGLWIGASIISVFQSVYYLAKHVWRKRKKSENRNKGIEKVLDFRVRFSSSPFSGKHVKPVATPPDYFPGDTVPRIYQ